MIKLGVNIDHVATLRNARGENHPDPLLAAKIAIQSGADSITIHLREDRRHINDLDVYNICKEKKIPVNLEMALDKKILNIVLKNKPNFVCIVPEKRKEVTTEGGLDLLKNKKELTHTINKLKKSNIRISLFINPNLKNIKIASSFKTDCIELHTGRISNLIKSKKNHLNEFNKILACAKLAKKLNLEVHAGHGMDYKTTKILSKIRIIKEFNIGHFIIGESIFYGFKNVIQKFKKLSK